VQDKESESNSTICYTHCNNHSRRVLLQVWRAPDYSCRRGQFSQSLRNVHILIVWLEAFWRQPYTLQGILVFCSTTSGALRSTGEAVSERLRAHCFAFSLSGNIWEHLEGSVWLFRVAELFSYDFQTILHVADEDRRYFQNMRDLKMHSPVHLLHIRQWYFVLILAKFVIWSGG